MKRIILALNLLIRYLVEVSVVLVFIIPIAVITFFVVIAYKLLKRAINGDE